VHSLVVALIFTPVILRVREDIVNVYNTTLNHGTARRRASIPMDGIWFHDPFKKFIRMAIAGRNSINVAILSVDETLLRIA